MPTAQCIINIGTSTAAKITKVEPCNNTFVRSLSCNRAMLSNSSAIKAESFCPSSYKTTLASVSLTSNGKSKFEAYYKTGVSKPAMIFAVPHTHIRSQPPSMS